MDEKKASRFCIGENIKRHRKRLGITQEKLAGHLCVTPQNISKWERDLSCPGVFLLAELAEFFGVSMDELVGRSEVLHEKRFIAIDGGGTKTEFCLFSQSGHIYKKIILPGTNPNSVGIENTKKVLSDGISQLCSESSDVCMIYAGIAGCGAEHWRGEVGAHIRKQCPYSRVDVGSDVPSVIAGAPVDGNFITVICGTGFVIYAKHGEALKKYSGFGYLFDDGLCGYTLGREAIAETLAFESGLTQSSLVSKFVQARLGANASDSIDKIYSGNADYIASFSRAVFDAYDSGDSTAADILTKLSENTAFLLEKAYESGGCGNKVVISGGLAARKDVVRRFLHTATGGKFIFYFTELPQIYGSIIQCIKHYDKKLADNEFQNKIAKALGGKAL